MDFQNRIQISDKHRNAIQRINGQLTTITTALNLKKLDLQLIPDLRQYMIQALGLLTKARTTQVLVFRDMAETYFQDPYACFYFINDDYIAEVTNGIRNC